MRVIEELRIKKMGKEGLPNYFADLKESDNQLLANIKAKLPELVTLLKEIRERGVSISLP